VTFEVDSRQTLEVRELLGERSINVSTSTPFSAPYDMRFRGIEGLVRASVHAYNTDEEIDDLVSVIQILA
jgi:selenocysteine lyase/cysteine desulfurase